MRTITVSGAKIEVPANCACGSVPIAAEAVDYVRKWNELADTCSFCGNPIKLIAGPLEHVHCEPKERDAWAIQEPQWEPNVSWLHSGPDFMVDIHGHLECAKTGMPYLNWVDPPSWEDVLPDVELPQVRVSPCEECGAVAGEEDIRSVVARAYGLAHGAVCVYCGGVIRLLEIEVRHRALTGTHTGRWHFKGRKWSRRFDWCIYRGPPSYVLEVRGHLRCAMEKMPHAKWSLSQKR